MLLRVRECVSCLLFKFTAYLSWVSCCFCPNMDSSRRKCYRHFFFATFSTLFLWVCHLKFGFCRELQLDAKSGSCKTKEKCDCLVITWYFPYAVFFFSLYQYISKQNVAFYTSGATSQIRWAYGTELWKCYSPNTLVKMEPCQIMIMWYKIYWFTLL